MESKLVSISRISFSSSPAIIIIYWYKSVVRELRVDIKMLLLIEFTYVFSTTRKVIVVWCFDEM